MEGGDFSALGEKAGLTLIEVGDSRSLRGAMGMWSGLGRTLSIVEKVKREIWFQRPGGRLLREYQKIQELRQSGGKSLLVYEYQILCLKSKNGFV